MARIKDNGVNVEVKPYKGYYVTKDGRVYDREGTKVKVKGDSVTLAFDGQKHTYKRARVVYEAYTGKEIGKGMIYLYKDGNEENPSLDNIIILSRKEYFKDKEWGTEKLSLEQQQQLAEEFDRKYRMENGIIRKRIHPTYAELSEKYGVSKSTILNILNKMDRRLSAKQ